MERRGRCCDPSDELMIFVQENVKFVSKVGFRTLLRPGTIAASPRFRLIPPRGVGMRMTGFRRDG